MADRFDLEQAILSNANIYQMLDAAVTNYEDDFDADALVKNVAAIRTVLDLHQDHLWRTFEDCVKNRNI